MIRAILACDEKWGIGKSGTLPWPHNSDDLQWFKECTNGCAVVMGRNTWEGLPFKPLPNRQNIVVSTTEVEGATHTFGEGFKDRIVDLNFEFPVWIIGGAQLVEYCLDIIDEIWLSRIGGEYDCDTFLPRTLISENFTLTDSGLRGKVYVDVWSKR